MIEPEPPEPGQIVRNRFGAVMLAVVLLGVVLAIFPATAMFGGVLCLLAIIPAIVAVWLVRRGSTRNRWISGAAVVLAPVFLIVAALLSPQPTSGATANDAVPLVSSTGVISGQQSPTSTAPSATPAPSLTPSPTPTPAGLTAPAAPIHVSTATGAAALGRTATSTAVARATAPARSNTTKSKTPPSTPSKPDPGPGCDESTHYVNSDGTCVHRPTSAPSAPSGASARCNDSTYSYSKHRQGTCSGHHGVAQWL